MPTYDVMSVIKKILEHSRDSKISFKSVGYPETYPDGGDAEMSSSVDAVSRDAYFEYQVDSLSTLARISESHRSYETKNIFSRWIIGKLRKYLFREMDFRYGLMFENQQAFNIHAIESLKILKVSVDELRSAQGSAEMSVEDLRASLLEKEYRANALAASIDDVKKQIAEKEGQMSLLERSFHTELQEVQYPSLDIDYFKFENRFRGPESEIRQRIQKYIKYFENRKNVLDVGCGRGEFLDLCKDNWIHAVGLDTNKQFCEYVASKGNEVVCEDAFQYLNKVEGESLDGVFAAHVLEHLTEKDLVRAISLFYEKLAPGSFCVIETPNAESLYGLSHWFYMDLTHRKPLHPLTLEFLFKEQGFSHVEILRVDYQDYEKMNDTEKLLMAPADFAIIARK
ncbi:MAG: class I SAM-dependent methyltransferase [Candidatus Peregrinibacteria bacterium]|nr:class I SAM-dependent methyltransferase [Candidatus Peregrinibacteria bacterium]